MPELPADLVDGWATEADRVEVPQGLTGFDVIPVPLTEEDYALAREMAREACVGGQSAIFTDPNQRASALAVNQEVGQLVTLAGHLWLYGTTSLYKADRERQNAAKTRGDGGSDVGQHSNIDFKGSLMKRDPNPLAYNLLVRPDELHPGWIYILGLARYEPGQPVPDVYLVGWATSDMLKPRYTNAARFGGEGKVHAMRATDLRPLPPFHWSVRRPLRYG